MAPLAPPGLPPLREPLPRDPAEAVVVAVDMMNSVDEVMNRMTCLCCSQEGTIAN